MTGAEMVTEFKAIVRNDLYPIGVSTDGAICSALTVQAKKVMQMLKIDIPVPSDLSVITGTVRYSLDAIASPLVEVNKVQTATTAFLPKSPVPANKGWNQAGYFLDLFGDLSTGDVYKLYGYQGCSAIVNDSSPITDIPVEVHMAIIMLAVKNACGAQEDAPNQLLRLQGMERQAFTLIAHHVSFLRSGAWPF